MDKQTTLAFVLIGIILVVWLYINAPEPQEQLPQTADSTIVKETPKEVVPESKPEIKEPETKKQETKTSKVFQTDENKKERIITVDTDLAKIEFTSKGGKIRKYYLKDYQTWYAPKLPEDASFYDQHVQLVNQQDDGDFNIIFVSKNGEYVNTGDLDFEPSVNNYKYTVTGDDVFTLAYTFTDANGRAIKKTFNIKGNNYASNIEIELINMNDLISSYRYDVVWSTGINFVEENSEDEARYSNASAYSGDELVELDASSEGEKLNKDINGSIDWVGVKNKYFAIIFSPDEKNADGGAYLEGEHVKNPQYGAREYYSSSLKIPFNDSQYQKNGFQLYMGPVDYDVLKSYGKGYEHFFEFGSFMGLDIFQPISEYILLPLFKFLHGFIPNYGFVLIVFSIIIKFALYPLTKQSFKSMKRMQMLQPKIAELKEKYKDDQQRVQKETMKLYQTYGINPAGGCLPMLLQMPILVALWTLFNVAIELRGEPFMFWITNLAAPDVLIELPFKIPLFGFDKITGLAPLLGITMFFQQKMSVKDPSQKAMVYMMPIMFTAMFMGFPSGLNLYYLMFNFFSIAQQLYINKFGADEELVPVKKGDKKGGGFMQRMMDAAEKQTQAQKKTQKKGRK